MIRVVPRVERGECVNAGVILYCATRGYLAARISLDGTRLRALAPDIDLELVERALAVYPLIAAGDPAAGPIAALSTSERFHWLVAPRSTITQTSAVHSGLCDHPDAALQRLVTRLVEGP
jgi:hypothetical protein